MKKSLIVLLALCLMLAPLAGCANKASPADDEYPFDRIVLEGAENVRDIGGYAAKDGKNIAKGKFIRSDHLGKLTEKDEKILLKDRKVDCVIDLRGEKDITKTPDTIAENANIIYCNIVIPNDSTLDSLYAFYVGMLEDGKAEWKQVMDIAADSQYKTILYHCSAGKDRTGLLTMMLLGLAGVDEATIVADYAVSQELLVNFMAENLAKQSDRPHFWYMTPAEEMEKTLAYINENYGSIPGYLTEIGVTQEQQDAILKKLLA